MDHVDIKIKRTRTVATVTMGDGTRAMFPNLSTHRIGKDYACVDCGAVCPSWLDDGGDADRAMGRCPEADERPGEWVGPFPRTDWKLQTLARV